MNSAFQNVNTSVYLKCTQVYLEYSSTLAQTSICNTILVDNYSKMHLVQTLSIPIYSVPQIHCYTKLHMNKLCVNNIIII